MNISIVQNYLVTWGWYWPTGLLAEMLDHSQLPDLVQSSELHDLSICNFHRLHQNGQAAFCILEKDEGQDPEGSFSLVESQNLSLYSWP